MNPRDLAALLSSLISQLLLLLLLIFPPLDQSDPISSPIPTFQTRIFSLLHHFTSASEIAAALSRRRKRKRTLFVDPNALEDEVATRSKLGQPGGVDSAIPRSPDCFKQLFSMESSTFQWLCGLLEPLLDCRDPVDSPLSLPAETRLGIGLFRLAAGADYSETSRRFRVSEPVARFCVKQLCRVLCTNFRFWVGFPSQEELDSVSTQFESLAGLPNCCGIITCTRFKITRNNHALNGSDSIPQEKTIAAQMVIDSRSRILSIVAGYNGDMTDSRVLKSSSLFKSIEKGELLNNNVNYIDNIDVHVPQYLIGDGDYPLLPWLLVPFLDPVTASCELSFNDAVDSMRSPARKAVASLRCWGVLSKPIEAEFKAAVSYVGACSILHNMLLMREDHSAFRDMGSDCSMRSQIPRHCKDDWVMDESSFGGKAPAIRRALARKAKFFIESGRN